MYQGLTNLHGLAEKRALGGGAFTGKKFRMKSHFPIHRKLGNQDYLSPLTSLILWLLKMLFSFISRELNKKTSAQTIVPTKTRTLNSKVQVVTPYLLVEKTNPHLSKTN